MILRDDAFYKIYKFTYRTMYGMARYNKRKKIDRVDFNKWSFIAKEKINEFRNVEDGLNKYKQWLEQSKKLEELK